MNQIRILHNSYKSSHPPLVSVSSVHFMNQTERLLRKWREYFLDLKDMRLFLAIAEENNLTRAAQKNGYTQSAASHMLRNIETELGFSLFSRSQRGPARHCFPRSGGRWRRRNILIRQLPPSEVSRPGTSGSALT